MIYCQTISHGFKPAFGAMNGQDAAQKAANASQKGKAALQKPWGPGDSAAMFGDGLETAGDYQPMGRTPLLNFFRGASKKAVNARLNQINGKPTPFMRLVTAPGIKPEEKRAILEDLASNQSKDKDLAKIDFAATHLGPKGDLNNGKTAFDFAYEQSPQMFCAVLQCYLKKVRTVNVTSNTSLAEFYRSMGWRLSTGDRAPLEQRLFRALTLVSRTAKSDLFAAVKAAVSNQPILPDNFYLKDYSTPTTERLILMYLTIVKANLNAANPLFNRIGTSTAQLFDRKPGLLDIQDSTFHYLFNSGEWKAFWPAFPSSKLKTQANERARNLQIPGY